MTSAAHAGWATCDITPPLGLPMGGRGARFSPATSILDPLLAQAFVLRDEAGYTTAWLSVDLVEVPDKVLNLVCDSLAAALGTVPAAILINASHTHSCPMMGHECYATLKPVSDPMAAYFESLTEAMIKVTLEAAKNLQQVHVTWRMGQTDIGINRRKVIDGQMEIAPNPEGDYDPSLWLLEVQAVNDAHQRCLLIAHGCHPVMVYGFAWNAISAEWPGQMRLALNQSLGSQVHCQFFQGMSGNVRPRILSDMNTGKFRLATWEDVVAVGQKIAGDALSLLKEPGQNITPRLAAARTHFVAHRETNLPEAAHWESMLESEHEHFREAAAYWMKRCEPGDIPPFPTTPWPAGMVQLTPEHLIVYLGGEPVAQWCQIIEAALPGRKITAWGYTNQYVGYLPADDMLPEGGYEVSGYPPLGRQSPLPFVHGLNSAGAKAIKQMAASLAT